MKKTLLIASGALAVLAVPAIATHHQEGAQDMKAMMASDMTRAQMEAMVKQRFAEVDANKDGVVTMDEVKARTEARRMARMDAHFKAMDGNSDDSISRDEFFAGHKAGAGAMAMHDDDDDDADDADSPQPMGGHGHGHGMKGAGMKMADRLFDTADTNNDGKITLAEATKNALARFDKMDSNKNGTVTAGERMDYIRARMKEWRAGKGE